MSIGDRTRRYPFVLLMTLGCLVVANTSAAQNATTMDPVPAKETAATEVASVNEVDRDALFAKVTRLHSEIIALEAKARSAAGDDAWLLEEEAREKRVSYREQMGQLVGELVKKPTSAGTEQNQKIVREVTALLKKDIQIVRKKIQRSGRMARRFRALRSRKRGDERFEVDFDLATERARLDDYYASWTAYVQALLKLDKAEMPASAALDNALKDRAERLVTLIGVEDRQVKDLAKQVAASDSEKERQQSEVRAAQQRARGVLASLEATVKHMKASGLDTATLDQQIIEATGQLDTNILDSRVALGLARRWMDRGHSWITESGPPILFKLLLVIVMYLVIRGAVVVVRRMVRGLMARRSDASALLKRFVEVAAGKAVVFFGLLVALSVVGINLAPVLAGLGIVGFVVGFALQDTLGNFGAGMLILLYRPFDEGDLIEAAGVQGHVAHLSLVSTTVQTLDNQRLIIPNRQVWSNVIRNVFGEETRRVDLVFGISYSDDIMRAREIIEQILEENEQVLADPEPVVRVHTLNDSSVDFVVRPWTNSENYWEVHWSVTEQVKLRFDAQGISIPFPQRDVHIYQSSASA